MSNEPLALSIVPPPSAPSEDDYRAFCAALETSARGRAFLAEYAKRNRNADTEMLLAALGRLEALIRTEGTALQRLRDELRMLLTAIRRARPDIEASNLPTKAAKLALLLNLLERRIDAMVESRPAQAASAAPAQALPAQPAEAARAPLAVVPLPEEPELPIPSPAGAQPPAFALVGGSAAIMPEVAWFDGAAKPAAKPAVTEQPTAAPLAAKPPAAPAIKAVPPPADALAALMALTEHERIALFT
jgi:hypothetical protein